MTEQEIEEAFAHPLAVKIRERVDWAIRLGYTIRPLCWGVGFPIKGQVYRCPHISYCCPLATLLVNKVCEHGYINDVCRELGDYNLVPFVSGFLYAWDDTPGWDNSSFYKLAIGQLGHQVGLAFRATYYNPVPDPYPGMVAPPSN